MTIPSLPHRSPLRRTHPVALEAELEEQEAYECDPDGEGEHFTGLRGNKISLALSFGGKENKETMTILKLTDDELETEDSMGKKETLVRLKAK